MRLLCALAVLLAVASAQSGWVVQNLYRNAASACAPQDLAQASSWLNNTCVKSNATHWLLQVCNSTGVVSASCTDPQCTRCPEISAYPTQRCGTISRNGTNQGLFFTCYVGQTPPTLSSQNNAVYNERTYFGDAGCGGVAQIYSQISTVSGVCVVGEKRTCSQCTNGGTCTAATFSDCNGTQVSAVNLNTCVPKTVAGNAYRITTTCSAAVAPTPTPVDPNNPNAPDPNTIVSCESATNFDQCVNFALTSSGKPTLPVTGLINKCCVWCGNADNTGSCRTPYFSTLSCSCPAPPRTNFTDQVRIYGCPSNTAAVGCQCTGKPPGAPQCSATALSSLLALVVAVVLVAVSLL